MLECLRRERLSRSLLRKPRGESALDFHCPLKGRTLFSSRSVSTLLFNAGQSRLMRRGVLELPSLEYDTDAFYGACRLGPKSITLFSFFI